MAIIALVPFVLRDCTLNIKDGATDIGDFQGHVSKVSFEPNANVQTWKGLTPTAVFQDVDNAGWTVALDYAQDFATINSLANYLFANPGKQITMAFTPKSGGKKATATVVCVPGAIGGGVGEYATSSVTLPVIGVPVLS